LVRLKKKKTSENTEKDRVNEQQRLTVKFSLLNDRLEQEIAEGEPADPKETPIV
jgi:hypothetical protein